MLPIEDFDQRYRNTYLRTQTGDVLYIESVSFSNNLVNGRSYFGGAFSFNYPELLNTLNFEMPDSGYFNQNGNAIYLYRLYHRQWRRGICAETFEFVNPLKRLGIEKGLFVPRMGFTVLTQLMLKFDPLIDADSLQISKAITKNIAVSWSPIPDFKFIVWYDLHPVGGFNEPGTTLYITDREFFQEVSDSIRNHNLWSLWPNLKIRG